MMKEKLVEREDVLANITAWGAYDEFEEDDDFEEFLEWLEWDAPDRFYLDDVPDPDNEWIAWYCYNAGLYLPDDRWDSAYMETLVAAGNTYYSYHAIKNWPGNRVDVLLREAIITVPFSL